MKVVIKETEMVDVITSIILDPAYTNDKSFLDMAKTMSEDNGFAKATDAEVLDMMAHHMLDDAFVSWCVDNQGKDPLAYTEKRQVADVTMEDITISVVEESVLRNYYEAA